MVLAELKATGGEIRRGENRTVSQCFGTVPQFIDVANLSVTSRGRYLTQSDLDQKNPVAVIGYEVARQFFRLEDPIGSSIRINEVVFTVVGVLEPVGFAGGAWCRSARPRSQQGHPHPRSPPHSTASETSS